MEADYQAELIDCLKGCHLSVCEDDDIIRASSGQGCSLSSLQDLLERCGYKFYDRTVLSDDVECAEIILEGDAWNGVIPNIYFTIRQAWEDLKNEDVIPASYLVVKGESEEKIKFSRAVRLYSHVKNILSNISDHHGSSSGVLLFHNKNDSIRKEAVYFNISLEQLMGVSLDDSKDIAIEEILSYSQNEDVHSKERVSVLKNVIIESLDSDGSSSFFYLIYSGAEKILSKYRQQYDLYLHEFSVKKILNDIDEKRLEYSAKLNDFVSSSQTKAFAIPGALIAVGALVRGGPSLISFFLILAGLYVVRSFVISANKVYKQSLRDLKEQAFGSFDKFISLDDSAEVKSQSDISKRSISDRIRLAEERLDDIDKYATGMLVAGFLYFLGEMAFSNTELIKQVFSYGADKFHALVDYVRSFRSP